MVAGIDIGRLDVLLHIEKETIVRDSINAANSTWSVHKHAFGKRVWKSGPEVFESKQLVDSDDVQFMIRCDETVVATMRFKQHLDTNYFYIKSTEHWFREGYTMITAERRDNQASGQ